MYLLFLVLLMKGPSGELSSYSRYMEDAEVAARMRII